MHRFYAAAVVALVATSAGAQPTSPKKPPTAKEKQQAGDLTKQAIAKSQGGDHQAAIDLYLQAYGIVPLPLLLSNIGSEYKALEKPVEALKYFCKYLEAEPTGSNASYAISEAKVIQTGLGNPNLDDKVVCTTPPPAPKPDPAPEPTPPPPRPADTAPGRPMQIAGLSVAGVGVVGLGIGVFYGLRARTISNEISNHDKTMPWPTDIQDKEAEGQSAENRQIAFLIIGSALVAGGGILYYLGHSKNESAMTVTPVAGAGTVGLVLDGSF